MSGRESLIVGFLKVRNEIIREGNIYRCLQNMKDICDDIYAVDDSSYDGTFEYLKSQLPEDHIIRVLPDKHDFSSELYWKQELIELIHKNGPWNFIFWQDADEVLDAKGTAEIRNFCRGNLHTQAQAWAFHYAQLWRGSKWARTDSEFDDGWFVKLWRYHPELAFNIQPGTHNSQFPHQIHAAFTVGKVERSPWEVLHYGRQKHGLAFLPRNADRSIKATSFFLCLRALAKDPFGKINSPPKLRQHCINVRILALNDFIKLGG